ncbi:MAG: acyl carrier protein [Thermodesulfobacteriota bacterium]
MKRDEIEKTILEIMEREFDIKDPDRDVNLAEAYEFDSIDALEMLSQVEQEFGALTMDEKKQLFEYRTINLICDYLAAVFTSRAA